MDKIEGIKSIRLGEIIRIEGEDYVIFPRENNNGFMKWEQPSLIKLKYAIENIGRKAYLRRRGFKEFPSKTMTKKFKSKKMTNIRK